MLLSVPTLSQLNSYILLPTLCVRVWEVTTTYCVFLHRQRTL